MRVLFFATDPLTAETRIEPLLQILRESARIAGYDRVDRDMAISRRAFDRYDVVLTHRNPSRRQIAWLRRHPSPFVYDIDDLLLQGMTTRARQLGEQAAIEWCLSHAFRITSPSARLLSMLARRMSTSFEARAVLLPNTGLEQTPPPKSGEKPRLLWVSSDFLKFPTAELEGIFQGVSAAVGELGIDTLLLGRFAETLPPELARGEQIRWLAHDDYRRLLGKGDFVAVAPLSIGLPPELQCVEDCKSDVKAAEFGSSRIDAAYSAAAPYTDSHLPCSIVPANTARDWRQAIIRLVEGFPNAGNGLGENPAFSERRPSFVALQLFECLLQASKIGAPVAFRSIRTPRFARDAERKLRALRLRLLPRRDKNPAPQ
jgi:hypothetical protein